MNGKRILGAFGIVLATFVGAGTLVKWANETRTTPDDASSLSSGSQPELPTSDLAKKSADKLNNFAKDSANKAVKATTTVAKPIVDSAKSALETKPITIDTANTIKDIGTGIVKTAANAVAKSASKPAKFVELKLAPNAPQVIAGRAPKGTRITVLKDGTSIGTTVTSQTGMWSFKIDPPIADNTYRLSLQSNENGGDTVLGQSVEVSLDETGRAGITLKPAPKPAEKTTNVAIETPSATETPANPSKSDDALLTKTAEAGTGTSSQVSEKTTSVTQPKPDTESNANTDSAATTDKSSDTPPKATSEFGTEVSSNNTAAESLAGTTASETKTTGVTEKNKSSDDTAIGNTSTETVRATPDPSKTALTTEQASNTSAAGTKAVETQTLKTKSGETEEPGIIDGLIDQASKMAEAASEKFSDVLGSSTTPTDQAPTNTNENTKTASNETSSPEAPTNTESTPQGSQDKTDSQSENSQNDAAPETDSASTTTTGGGAKPETKIAEVETTPTGTVATPSRQPDATDTAGTSESNTSAQTKSRPVAKTKTKRSVRKSRRARRTKTRKRRAVRRATRARSKRRAKKTIASARGPYIRNRPNGPWAGVRVTRLRSVSSQRRHGLSKVKPFAKRPIGQKARHIKRFKN